VQWVNREHGGDESTGRERSSRLQQHQEEDDCGGPVQDDIRQVMSTRVRHAVQFDICHVRQPGERMPVGRVAPGERPADPLESQTA
jgi:hypothetical protein